ncbi:MAG: hypothetical protein ACI8RZ_004681 [Myxococcota bacterium]|jgi:hypothetical protein
MNLEQRLHPFLDAGLLTALPTPTQIRQGELEMMLYVISTDVTEEALYAGAPLGHPMLRQPIIASRIGLDHFRIGTGLGAKAISMVRHLQFTIHQDMPVWDLQLLQTHPDGLALLTEETEALLSAATPASASNLRLLRLICPAPEDYLRRFLGDDGWIARAQRLDYAPTPDCLPAEFASLTGFLTHCTTHPQRLTLRRAAWLMVRRLREGRGMGWFAPKALR